MTELKDRVRLTGLTQAAGCAAKLAPGALAQVLGDIPKLKNENLMVGYDTSDDACVYRINDSLASVMTVDFFPPMVDDPYLFGQIAAANALSDVYAMGGTPSHAVNLLCFPACLGVEVAGQILRGGADKAAEADCVIAGGHTIMDNVPKYGLCVHGFVHPDRILKNSGALPGDRLILTKRVGTGILTTALKGEFLKEEDILEATMSMCTLNRVAAETAVNYEVHACTDITGFGVAGHLCEMAQGSGVTAVIDAASVPKLKYALDMARLGMLPSGTYRNREHFGRFISIAGTVPLELADLLFDPQTSGGLLFAVAQKDCAALLDALKRASLPAECIGHMIPATDNLSVKVN